MNIPIKVDPGNAEQKIEGVVGKLAKLEEEAKQTQIACTNLGATFKGIANAHLEQSLSATAKGFESLTTQIKHEQAALERIHKPLKQLEDDMRTLESLQRQGKITAAQYAAELERIGKAAGLSRGNPLDAVSLGKPPKASNGYDSIAGMLPGPGGAALAVGTAVAGGLKQEIDNFVEHRRATEEATNSILKFHDSFETASSAMVEQKQLAADLHIEIRRTAAAYGAVREASADMYLTSAQQVDITRNLTAAIVADGGAIEDVSGVMQKFQVAMEAGGMSARELKGILLQSDDVMGMMEKSTGKTYQELMALAKAGKLNTEILQQAVTGFASNDDAMQKYGERAMDLTKTMDDLHLNIYEAARVIGEAKEKFEAAAPSLAEPFLRGIAAAKKFHDLTVTATVSMRLLAAIAQLAAGGKIVDEATQKIGNFNDVMQITGVKAVLDYDDAIRKLKQAVVDGMIGPDLYAKGVKNLDEAMAGGTKSAKAHVDILKKHADVLALIKSANGYRPVDENLQSTQWLREQQRREKQSALDDSMGGRGLLGGIEDTRNMINSGTSGAQRAEDEARAESAKKIADETERTAKAAKEAQEAIVTMGDIMANELVGAATSLTDTMIEAARGGEVSWEQWGEQVFDSITRAIALAIVLKGLTGSFDGSKGAAGWGGLLGMIPGMSTGGTILPSGSGSTDTRLIALRTRPDETMHINTPPQERAYQNALRGQGQVGSGARGRGAGRRMDVAVDDSSALLQQLDGPEGDRVILNIVRRNRGAFRGL